MATIIPIDISNTSTLNSGAVNTSENSFEELEELNSSLEIYENEESLEILGVFDTLDGPESLSDWINKKYLMLDTVIDLGRQIEELELSTLEKYSDHYDTWWKKYEDAITEIANLKGRYFQLDQPNLLESPDGSLVLNPYIDHFEDGESDWVPFAYSKNEYWSWLNSQNEFIEKLGLSQQPPDISGNFENLQSSIDNAKSDRSWKIGRVNGSEFAQALIQSIDNLAKNSIDLNSYIVENNSDEDGFKYSTKSNVFGVRYVSQAPGILYSTNPGSRNGFEFDSGLSGGIGNPIPGGPFTDSPQLLENEKTALDNQDGKKEDGTGGEAGIGALNNQSGGGMPISNPFNPSSSDDPNNGVPIDISPKPSVYSDFSFINYNILASILKGTANQITSPDSGEFLEALLNIESDTLQIDDEWHESVNGDIHGVYYSFAQQQNLYIQRFKSWWNDPQKDTYPIYYWPNTVNTKNVFNIMVDHSLKVGLPLFSQEDTREKDLSNSGRYKNIFYHLIRIYRCIILEAIKMMHSSMASEFGDIGSLESLTNYILEELKTSDSVLQNILLKVINNLPSPDLYYRLVWEIDGTFNLIHVPSIDSVQGISMSNMLTPGSDQTSTPHLAQIYIEFKKLISSEGLLTISDSVSSTVPIDSLPGEIYISNSPDGQNGSYITGFNMEYNDPMKVSRKSYLKPNNKFWSDDFANLISRLDSDNSFAAIKESLKEIDSLESSKISSSNKYIEFKSTIITENLRELITKKYLDLGFVFKNYALWSQQQRSIKDNLLPKSNSFISKKYIALRDRNSIDASDTTMHGKSLIVVGIPFTKRAASYGANSLAVYVDGVELVPDEVSGSESSEFMDYLNIVYGVDFAVENFPEERIWNKQYASDLVLENDEIFGFSKKSFDKGFQIEAIETKWLAFPLFFPEQLVSQILNKKKFFKILVIAVDKTKIVGDIFVKIDT